MWRTFLSAWHLETQFNLPHNPEVDIMIFLILQRGKVKEVSQVTDLAND